MTLKEALEEVKKNIDTETDVSVNVNGLQIEVSGYSNLAQTCWLTFAMKDLGKRIGKDYLGDGYDEEFAQWNICKEIEKVVKKISN